MISQEIPKSRAVTGPSNDFDARDLTQFPNFTSHPKSASWSEVRIKLCEMIHLPETAKTGAL